ncbi:hypothetical protein KKA47_05000 [bacterium]|nr:hypothetical protein [bacterium]
MSLNQKYTWTQFLKENPELKAKRIKRTSAEGVKAFETAYKAKVKDILKDRLTFIDREKKRATDSKTEIVKKMRGNKNAPKVKILQKKVGRMDNYLSRLDKATESNKKLSKSF